MLKIIVSVKVYDGFRYEDKTEDIERYDVFRCLDESVTKEQIIRKVKDKYIGTPIEFQKINSIEKVDEDFFANMGDI